MTDDTDTHEPTHEPAGEPSATTRSVAEEAALLVDLLSSRGWGGTGRGSSRSAGPDASAGSDDPTGATGATGSGGQAAADHGPDTHECTCGGRTPAACAVCPVCQLIAFVQRIEPETIERFADVVGFAATALRDLATVQRERRERSAPDAASEDGKEGPQ